MTDRRPAAGATGASPSDRSSTASAPLAGATVIEAWIRTAAGMVHEHRTWLTELDAAIGDGDHGINLDRGFAGVVADLDAAGTLPRDPAAVLETAGRRILGLVGGASGALYGRGLMVAGARLRDAQTDPARDTGGLVLVVIEGAVDAIAALGHASPGDKTMLDALVPAREALRTSLSQNPLPGALAAMAAAAVAGAEATTPLVARKGRASYLGERSAGHLDPGAASSALLVGCLADVLGGSAGRRRPEG